MSNNYKSENKLCVQLTTFKDLENQRTRLQEKIQECERSREFQQQDEVKVKVKVKSQG